MEAFYRVKSLLLHHYKQCWYFLALSEVFRVDKATREPFSAFILTDERLNSVLVDYLFSNNLGGSGLVCYGSGTTVPSQDSNNRVLCDGNGCKVVRYGNSRWVQRYGRSTILLRHSSGSSAMCVGGSSTVGCCGSGRSVPHRGSIS